MHTNNSELDQIQQKLNKKTDLATVSKEDLLEDLDESSEYQPRTPTALSTMGFGRPNRSKSSRSITRGTGARSVTPKRKMSKKLNTIGGGPLKNMNKKNVRALVYQDRSASKIAGKSTRKRARVRPSRELSISSDDSSSQDSNQPKDSTDELDEESCSISPNRSSKTLKKK